MKSIRFAKHNQYIFDCAIAENYRPIPAGFFLSDWNDLIIFLKEMFDGNGKRNHDEMLSLDLRRESLHRSQRQVSRVRLWCEGTQRRLYPSVENPR